MLRSHRCVFLSHCILAQTVRANGVAKYFPAAITPVVQWCMEHEINMIQMPCPEMLCPAGGLGRDPHGKAWYEQNGLRETSRRIAVEQANYAERLIQHGCAILAVIGMEFSPACATRYLNKGRSVYRAEGIYIEELKTELNRRGLHVPFIGVNQRGLKKLKKDLDGLLTSTS